VEKPFEARGASSIAPSSTRIPDVGGVEDSSPKKRKRNGLDEADPKLQEFLEVMGHQPKKSRNHGDLNGGLESEKIHTVAAAIEAGESDDEYEEIPARPLKPEPKKVSVPDKVVEAHQMDVDIPVAQPPDVTVEEVPQAAGAATDDDWLRSRTSRLLDLIDPDDPGFSARLSAAVPAAMPVRQPPPSAVAKDEPQGNTVGTLPEIEGELRPTGSDNPADLVQQTCRLFFRNLSYTATEDNIREHFSAFGNLEEVSRCRVFFPTRHLQ